MQYSDKPHKELQQAKDALADMTKAETLGDLESLWKRFLHHLERTWNKAEAHYCKSPKWSGWHGKYAQARKKDELLVYFVKARDADEHGIEDISQTEMGRVEVGMPQNPGPISINFSVGAGGRVRIHQASGPVEVTATAGQVRLLPVTNRGRTYEVPKQHLGNPINSSNLSELAMMGISYYEQFLLAADGFFVTEPRR